MPKKIIYLASPYGFAEQWREKLLPEFIDELEAIGAEVWEPFQRNNQIDTSRKGWAHKVAISDLEDVKNSDGMFAIINGTPPDEGVMIELGAAIALGKPIFLFRDDFRRCTDSEDYPLNLMVFAGLPAIGWEDYFYTSLIDIRTKDKSLYKWLKS
ncbi:nucleoside 2-deoxyribosyltransferase [Prochlorococcus sp. MIT 1223]|uniref:nucleoside 2-deoxyribosyltransferase n=1 Tax=Prochlorococcus sp. MIT 1223 TaxID=3096217 RepID=UPI002A763A65|nr:nucleoside 2-deoxyribosyltransferase [Prochlorococcus sp. MIT 1223]